MSTKKAGLPGFRFLDLSRCAIASFTENGEAGSTIIAITGHVSRKMLERYSHARMEAIRTAMEKPAQSSKMAGYETNHGTNVAPSNDRPVSIIEIFGGPGRDRTDDLFHAMEARSQTAPQAHERAECNSSILSAAAGFVKRSAVEIAGVVPAALRQGSADQG